MRGDRDRERGKEKNPRRNKRWEIDDRSENGRMREVVYTGHLSVTTEGDKGLINTAHVLIKNLAP